MSRILLCWELGGGWGHLMKLMPIAKGLLARGHHVHAALRDLYRARGVFGNDVALLQAPLRIRPLPNDVCQPMTLAHVLANNGYGQAQELAALCHAWHAIFDYVQPDLMICDHSPTALLAARGHSFKRCVVGTGFECPPDDYPLPNLRHWIAPDFAQLLYDEERILQNMNSAVHPVRAAPLNHVAALYAEADLTLLMTVPELDHYPNRAGAEYWGESASTAKEPPKWPTHGDGPRIFGYLKSIPALPDLLDQLNQWKFPTLIYVDGVDSKVTQPHASPTLHFAPHPVDLNDIGRQCDLALLHGSHGSTLSLLMAGKPTLQLPIFLEQVMLSQAVRRIGAGLAVPIDHSPAIVECLGKMVKSDQYSRAARGFAGQYAQSNSPSRHQQMLDRARSFIAQVKNHPGDVKFNTWPPFC